jgi:hypothetical protein
VFLPYFMAGIYLKDHYRFAVKHIGKILLASVLLYLSMLPFWGTGYWTQPEVFSWGRLSFEFFDLRKTLKIFLIMLSRIMLFFSLFYYIFNGGKKTIILLGNIGKYTLVIYIQQVIIIEHILSLFHGYTNTNSFVFQFIITPGISVLVIMFSILFYKFVHNWKYLEFVLFGNSYMKKNT